MRKHFRLRDRWAFNGRFRRFRRKVRQRQKLIFRRHGKRILPLARWAPSLGIPLRLVVPPRWKLGIAADRLQLLSFLQRLRIAYLVRAQPVFIDFRNVLSMEATATLLVMAEIDRMIRMAGDAQRLSCNLPIAETPRQVVHQIGLLDRLGFSTGHLDTAAYAENVRHWHYATGLTVGDNAGTFLDEYEGRIAPALLEGIWKGISEALVNSTEHAYLEDRQDGCAVAKERRWWMFTQEKDGLLAVVVCDLGIGMGRSLPKRWGKDIVARIFKEVGVKSGDLTAIRLALVIGETRTNKTNRGRGLPQIWNVAKTAGVGSVSILSGKGFLSYDANGDIERSNEFRTSVLGTLISWTLPVNARLA